VRKQSMFTSVLDEVEGIGEKRKRMLLKEFGSLKRLKQASVEEIQRVGIPQPVARALSEAIQEDSNK
jgi:excinuclease ABC subunit C